MWICVWKTFQNLLKQVKPIFTRPLKAGSVIFIYTPKVHKSSVVGGSFFGKIIIIWKDPSIFPRTSILYISSIFIDDGCWHDFVSLLFSSISACKAQKTESQKDHCGRLGDNRGSGGCNLKSCKNYTTKWRLHRVSIDRCYY